MQQQIRISNAENVYNSKIAWKGGDYFPGIFAKSEYFIWNAWNQHQISLKTFLGSKLLNQVNNFVNSLFMMMDYFPCPCKINIQNCFFGIRIVFLIRFPKSLLYILWQTYGLNIGKTNIIYKLKIIQEKAFSEGNLVLDKKPILT